MVMEFAAAAAAVAMYRSTKLRDLRKCTGKICFSRVVKRAKPCWKRYVMRTTPKTTHKAIADPEFQAYVEPEKDTTTMKRTNTAPLRTAPIQSISRSLWEKVRSGLGLKVGNMKKYMGAQTPASGRLM
jgi:hypothetical protein